MHVSSPRRRRAGLPNPIRTRRHANSPLFAGQSPAPWSPAQPTPPSGQSTDFQPFPVSPESMMTDSERELSPSDIMSPASTPRLTGILSRYGWIEGSSGRRESVESRTGGVPETPVTTPVGVFLPPEMAMAMAVRERSLAMRALIGMDESITSPRSPRWRGGERRSLRRMPNVESRMIGSNASSDEMAESRGMYGRIVDLADETEGVEQMVSDGNGAFGGVVEVEDSSDEAVEHTASGREKAKEGVQAAGMRVHRDGTGHAQPMSWWKYPWVVLMLVLFMLFVPSCKDIF